VIPVAMKQLVPHTGEHYNIEADWRKESVALSVFNRLEHEHIVKGIGAFTQRKKYYIVMEWANGGSLQHFWAENQNPHRYPSASQVMELLMQFRGLAQALKSMHYYNADQKQENTGLTPNKAAENNLGNLWRHGDVKPSNILVFKDPATWLGRLKLGDLGRAKRHDIRTGARNIPTTEMFGTWEYSPPEIWTHPTLPWSRLFDTWSFGCVLFESVLWLLYGATKLKEVERLGRESTNGSPYWTYESTRIDQRSAKICEEPSAWIEDILDSHPECQEPSAMRDLIKMIRDKLLVVRLSQDSTSPTERYRANSLVLCDAFEEILSRAQTDSSYLFKGESGPQGREPAIPSVGEVVPKVALLEPNRIISPGNIATRRTPWPLTARPSERKDSYLHNFDDDWKLEEDNEFARKVIDRPDINVRKLLPGNSSSLCEKCKNLDLTATSLRILDNVADLRIKSSECDFCDLRLRVAGKFRSGESVEFHKSSSGLRINSAFRLPPALSLRRTLGECALMLYLPGLPRALQMLTEN
jgi:serine/threonine protein kinase